MTTGIVGAFGFAQSIPDKDYCLPFWKWALNKVLPDSLDFKCPVYENLLGVATQTGNFTTNFNNFQDNEIINAGDWNAIEYAIGTTTQPTGGFSSSTATSTLFYLVKNTSSSDPGHKHTFSGSITGTSSVSQGGTGAGSFNKGLVMASGTNAFTSLQTNGNGSIPIASGTTWVANTLTAGTGINISNSPGVISISASGSNFATSTAGETLTTGDAVAIYNNNATSTIYNNSTANTATKLTGVTALTKIAVKFTPTSTYVVSKFFTIGSRTGSLMGNLIASLQADSAGAPSGIKLASSTIATSTVTVGATNLDFNLDLNPLVTGSTQYWFVMEMATPGNASNYFEFNATASGSTSYNYDGATWSADGTKAGNLTVYSRKLGKYVYKANATATSTSAMFIGFASQAYSTLDTATIYTGGSIHLGGLTSGEQYYVSNTPGAISIAPGTVTRKVGISVSTSTLIITNIW